MKITRTKVLVAIIVIGIITLLLISSYSSRQRPTSILPPGITGPTIPRYITTRFQTNFRVTEENFNSLPTSASLITISVSSPLSKEESTNIARGFGFTSEPLSFDDAFDGTTYIWSGSKDSLVVYSRSRRVEYSLASIGSVPNTQLSNQAITSTAQRFLSQKNLANNIDFSFFTFIKEAPRGEEGLNIVTKDAATIYQANFVPAINGAKILTLDPKSSPIYVWVLRNGTVAKAVATQFGSISKTQESYKLKAFQEVATKAGEATIVALDDGNINLVDLTKGEVESVTISEIDLAYLLDKPTSTILYPIYLLKGTAKIKGIPNSVSAFLYLPALAN